MVYQFIITLINLTNGVRVERVNCANETIARYICEGRHPNMRVIDIKIAK